MRRRWFLVGVVLVVAAVGGAMTTQAVAGSHRRSSQPDAEEQEDVVANPASSTGSCGVERWSVKTGTDADAGLINLQASTATTIAARDALPAPATLPSNNRVRPTETTLYQVSATLTQYKLEADSDYHLVLSDGGGHSMIAEIPDPLCVGSGSPLATGVKAARNDFDARYTPTGSFQNAGVAVTVTGVGFFDFQHGQTGVAPNAIELHAVLAVAFGSGGGGGCSGQKLGNPGFETGTAAPWSASSGVVSNSSSEPARTGSWDAWLDGYGRSHTDTLSQPVTIPARCHATLTFHLHIDTAETSTTTRFDTLTVTAAGTTLAAQTLTLTATGTEDSTQQTSFVLDDTALTIS